MREQSPSKLDQAARCLQSGSEFILSPLAGTASGQNGTVT